MRARHILALSICTGIAFAAHLVFADNPKITQLHWLVGRWQNVSETKRHATTTVRVNEDWRLVGDVMASMGVTLMGDSLVDAESVYVREMGSVLVYEAHAMGQKSAVFHSIKIGEKSIVFENLAHDFPQRVAYELVSDDSLLAWIEGPGKDGKTKRIQFPYRRVK